MTLIYLERILISLTILIGIIDCYAGVLIKKRRISVKDNRYFSWQISKNQFLIIILKTIIVSLSIYYIIDPPILSGFSGLPAVFYCLLVITNILDVRPFSKKEQNYNEIKAKHKDGGTFKL